MASFNINSFRSEVLTRDLARPSKFEVRITTPPVLLSFTEQAKLVSMFCESTNLPGMTIPTRAYRIYGPAYQRPVTADFGGDGITMVFNVDADMKIKKFFDAWMSNIVNPLTYNVNYSATYTTKKIDIIQLNNNDQEAYSVSLIDAFPRSMNLLDLSSSSTNQTHKLTVTFAYRKWEPNNAISKFNNYEVAGRADRFEAGAIPTINSRTNSFGTQTTSVDLITQVRNTTNKVVSGATTAVSTAVKSIKDILE